MRHSTESTLPLASEIGSESPPKHADALGGAHGIAGTPIFDGALARRGYALNRLCFSLNSRENRDALLRDEEAYCRQYGLNEEQTEALRSRNIQSLLSAGGNI
jgi:protocatechuate 4,5-dioxygenase alpha subunit